jgi:pimeloyl-ACP methyl ester carboxylesterase
MLMSIFATLLLAGDALSRAPSHSAPFETGHVHYKALGHGHTTVVFVHGWSCNLGVWRLQAESFPRRMRALFVDLPGHGGSEVPKTACTQDLFARAIDAVLRDARVKDAVIVGHSNGAITARHFYRLFPKETRGLVLVEGDLQPFVDLSAYPTVAARYDVADYKDKMAAVADSMTDLPTGVGLRPELRALMSSTPRSVVVSSLAELKDPKVWTPDPIQVPVLEIHVKAPYRTPEYEAFVRRLVPGIDYRTWENVGHFLMMERPAEFDAAVFGFLDGHHLLDD